MPKFTVNISIRYKQDANAERYVRALRELAEKPSIIANITRAAIAESILREYRVRFQAALPDAMNMEGQVVGERKRRKRRERAQKRKVEEDMSIEELFKAETARGVTDSYETQTLGEQLDAAREKKPSKDPNFAEHVLYKSGQGRQLMLERAKQLLEMLTAVSSIRKVASSGDSITFGVGNIEAMDKIETPSYTEWHNKHTSRSDFKILWRHLEFGTGRYGSYGPGTSWRYGAVKAAGTPVASSGSTTPTN